MYISYLFFTTFEAYFQISGSEMYIPDDAKRFVSEGDGSPGRPAYDISGSLVLAEKVAKTKANLHYTISCKKRQHMLY